MTEPGWSKEEDDDDFRCGRIRGGTRLVSVGGRGGDDRRRLPTSLLVGQGEGIWMLG